MTDDALVSGDDASVLAALTEEARQRRTEQDRAAVRAFLVWVMKHDDPLTDVTLTPDVLLNRVNTWPGTEGR